VKKKHRINAKNKNVRYWVVWALCLLAAASYSCPSYSPCSPLFMSPGEVALNYGEMALSDGFTPLHLLPDRVSLSGYYKILIETPQYLMRFGFPSGSAPRSAPGRCFCRFWEATPSPDSGSAFATGSFSESLS
jgi:hypothetical protein